MSFSQTNPHATPGSHRVSPRPTRKRGSANPRIFRRRPAPACARAAADVGRRDAAMMDACSRPLVPSEIGDAPGDRTHHAARRPSITLAIVPTCAMQSVAASISVPARAAASRRARARARPPPAHPSAPRRPTPRTRASRSSSTATASSSRLVRAANADHRAPRARLFDLVLRRRAEDPPRVARASDRADGLIHTRREMLRPLALAHFRSVPATQRSFTAARITRRSSTLSSPSTARRWTGPWSTTTSSPTPSAAESRR